MVRLENVESFHISAPPQVLNDTRYLRLLLALTVSQAAKAMEDGLNVKYYAAGRLFNGRALDDDLLYLQVRVPKKPFVDFWIGSQVNVELEVTNYNFGAKDVAVAYLTYMKRTNPTRDDLLSRLDEALQKPVETPTPEPTTYYRGQVMSIDGKEYIIGRVYNTDYVTTGRFQRQWSLRLDRKYERSIYITL